MVVFDVFLTLQKQKKKFVELGGFTFLKQRIVGGNVAKASDFSLFDNFFRNLTKKCCQLGKG